MDFLGSFAICTALQNARSLLTSFAFFLGFFEFHVLRLNIVRGLFSAIVPDSSLAEVRMGLLIEPTHMKDEDEEQENEKEDERDGGKQKGES